MPLPRALDLPPLWLALFAALAWAEARHVAQADPGTLQRGAGAVLVAAGALLFVLALVEFRRHRTTVIPHREPGALITTGVFRLTRNPIYLGDLLILAGLCLRWGALSGLVLVPGFALLVTRRFILPEEQRLGRNFGSSYEAWAKRTRRWI